MKILLTYQSGLPNRKDPYINLVPTGLCYLHACLQKAGYDSLLANFSAWQTSKIKQILQDFKPTVIGISQWTHNRHISIDLARTCRSILPDSLIIMGGGHATFCFDDILKEGSPVDCVIRGEGEATLLELLTRISSGTEWQSIAGVAFRHDSSIKITPARKNIEELDMLPLPAKHLNTSIGLDLELQAEFIVTTRGCPSTCYFCSSPDFWGRKIRFRSPAAIVEEIIYIRHTFGVIYFSIRDDTFTADRQRVVEFSSLLKQQDVNILWNCQSRVTAIDEDLVIRMKQAGCECIQLGVESGSPRILKQLGKKIVPTQIEQACAVIRKVGINLSLYLISDVPGETDADLQQTVKLVRQLHPDDGYVSPLAYYPGTRLYRDAVASGTAAADIFAERKQAALYVVPKPGDASVRLLRELTMNQQNDPERFCRQKELLGYCYTTNVIAAEWYRQQGKFDRAEKELREITVLQPNNPWGWFLLGDILTECGRTKKGQECYAKVLNIIPRHGSSIAAVSKR